MSARDEHHQLQNNFGNARYVLGQSTHDGSLHDFKVGQAATDSREAKLAVDFWHLDLVGLVAPIYFVSALFGLALTTYGLIRVHVWIWNFSALFIMEMLLAFLIWFCVCTMWARSRTKLQIGLVYFFEAVALFQLFSVLFWLPTLGTIYDAHPIYWWLMMAVLSVTALNGMGAVLALANWTARSMTVKGHINLATEKVRPVIAEEQRGEMMSSQTQSIGSEMGAVSFASLLQPVDQVLVPAQGLRDFAEILKLSGRAK